jgi:hypothetical protein
MNTIAKVADRWTKRPANAWVAVGRPLSRAQLCLVGGGLPKGGFGTKDVDVLKATSMLEGLPKGGF